MTAPGCYPNNRTLVYRAACPTCDDLVSWLHHPTEPFPQPRCPRPTCNTHRLVEK